MWPSSSLESELATMRQEKESLTQQLLNTIKHKVALSQELDAWQVSVRVKWFTGRGRTLVFHLNHSCCCRRTCGWWSINRCSRGRRRERGRNSERKTTQGAFKEASLWKWREKQGRGFSLSLKTNDGEGRQPFNQTVSAFIFATTNFCCSDTAESEMFTELMFWYICEYVCTVYQSYQFLGL